MRMNQLITLVCSFVMACGILSAQPSAFYDGHIPNPNVTAFLKHSDIPVNLSRGLPQIGVSIDMRSKECITKRLARKTWYLQLIENKK